MTYQGCGLAHNHVALSAAEGSKVVLGILAFKTATVGHDGDVVLEHNVLMATSLGSSAALGTTSLGIAIAADHPPRVGHPSAGDFLGKQAFQSPNRLALWLIKSIPGYLFTGCQLVQGWTIWGRSRTGLNCS